MGPALAVSLTVALTVGLSVGLSAVTTAAGQAQSGSHAQSPHRAPLLISATAAGLPANGASRDGALSRDGGRIVFASEANDLVPGARSGLLAVYVRDLTAETRARVDDRARGGAPAIGFIGVVWSGDGSAPAPRVRPAISADGRVVAFRSLSGGVDGPADDPALLVAELPPPGTAPAAAPQPLTAVDRSHDGAPPDGLAAAPSLSADGQRVAFHSRATTLVADDDNGYADVFVHDRATGRTVLVSRAPAGIPASGDSLRPALSADGRSVAFESSAPDLVAGDINGRVDVFVHDLSAGRTERVSVGPGGRRASADSHTASLSADGRRVAFASDAGELSPAAEDGASAIYVHDRATGRTQLVSVGRDGTVWRGQADQPALAPDGHRVAFRARRSDLEATPPGADDPRWPFLADLGAARIRSLALPTAAAVDQPASVDLGRWALAAAPFSRPLAAAAAGLVLDTDLPLVAGDSNTVRDVYALPAPLGAAGPHRLALPALRAP